MKRIIITAILLVGLNFVYSQSYAPPAGQPGSTAMHKDSSAFIAWATAVEVERGWVQIDDPTVEYDGTNKASFGTPENAIGQPDGTTTKAISLGDGGVAIIEFDKLIVNGEGWDFAVFENGVTDDFLELAFVEVSSDGVNYFRFPSHSELPFDTQIGGFGSIDCRYINNLAGKYKLNYGTPFDLDDLDDSPLLDKNAIRYVKIIDVIGTINPTYASYDSHGNIINDPYPTPFHSSGFDLTGVGVIHGIDKEPLAIDENKITDFQVFPTIAQTSITIHARSNFSYSIVDFQGRIWKNGEGQSGVNVISLEYLPQGVYLVEILSENTKSVHRIMK